MIDYQKNINKVIQNMREAKVDYIQQYRNALSPELCDYFIKKHKNLDKLNITQEGQAFGPDGKERVNKNSKMSKDVFLCAAEEKSKKGLYNMSEDETDNKMYDLLTKSINRHLYLYFLHVGIETPLYLGINKNNFNRYFKSESECPEMKGNIGVDTICLRSYEKNKGGYFTPHFDNKTNIFRLVGVIIYLNDIKFGGETEFPSKNRMIVPEKGSLAIFPSNFAYWHYGRKASSNKYAIVCHVSRYPLNQTKKEKK